MAERRMFSKTIIDSDLFLDMPLTTQALYFHLSMRADDEGFINNPKRIQRTVGASDDDLRLLIAKQYLIPFDTGVVVVRHWKIHNYIQSDRKKATQCIDEKSQLKVKNGVYTTMDTECIQNEYRLDTQDRLGKDRIDKDRLGKERGEEKKPDGLLDGLDVSEELKSTIRDFVKMRKLIKAPMTDRALKLMVDKLMEMGGNDETRIAILNQSIANSWKGIFPLHDTRKAENTQTKAEREEHEYASMLNRWAGG